MWNRILLVPALLLSVLLWLPQGSNLAAVPAAEGDSASERHPFHVSKCLMQYKPEQQSIQISMHIFLDDLELALEQAGDEDLYLCTGREAAHADRALAAYLNRHFQIKVNGKPADYEFIGKEISDDLAAVWCYMEATEVPAVESLDVRYSVLLDTYSDQKNLANIDWPNGKTGTLLFQEGAEQQRITL